jgi:ERCC4-type nuclease
MKPIENIFSPIPTKLENKTPIIIDTREKNSLVIANLMERKASIKFETLGIADYLINNIAIERKTFSDFISSMINKRLMTQLEGIKKYPSYFLIIEGENRIDDPSEYYRGKIHRRNREGFLDKAAKGMILSIINDYKIPIIFTKDSEETAEYLLLLAKQQDKPTQVQSLRYSPPKLSKKEQKQFILEGFPGIGPTTAKKLLKHFGSIKSIINASEEDLKKVIGKKAETFRLIG